MANANADAAIAVRFAVVLAAIAEPQLAKRDEERREGLTFFSEAQAQALF